MKIFIHDSAAPAPARNTTEMNGEPCGMVVYYQRIPVLGR
jgi:hypothetical protein